MEKYRFGLDAELAEGEDPLSFIHGCYLAALGCEQKEVSTSMRIKDVSTRFIGSFLSDAERRFRGTVTIEEIALEVTLAKLFVKAEESRR